MERRKFILDTLKTIPLFLLAPNLFASFSKDDDITNPNGKTVLVIGAGISGLAAAKKLKEKGFTVIVIEAQEKIGGRLRTDRSLGIAFDEGASWIHGPNGNPITKLASQAGATTYLTDDDNLAVFDNNGTAYSDTFLDSQYTEFEKALNAVRVAGTNGRVFKLFLTHYILHKLTIGFGNICFLPIWNLIRAAIFQNYRQNIFMMMKHFEEKM